jgi:hypothetical protein
VARPLRPGRGCTPLAASVVGGAVAGSLALSASGAGISPPGALFLLGGYVVGALVGHFAVVLLGRKVGEWWRD